NLDCLFPLWIGELRVGPSPFVRPTSSSASRVLMNAVPQWPVFRNQAQLNAAARPVAYKSRTQNSIALETMGRLVGGVAHDFNNLLTGILLYCDLLTTALEDRPRLQAQVREMRAAGEQGGALIQQLLTLARHQVTEPRPISWNDTILGLRSFLQ